MNENSNTPGCYVVLTEYLAIYEPTSSLNGA